MSSVLARFRGTTDCQCLTDARKIRADLLEWSFKEENIPKKYRNSFIPAIKTELNDIVNHTRAAQYSFPTDNEKLKARKEHIKLAEDAVVNLWQELQCLDDARRNSGGINLTKLEPVLTEIYNLQLALRTWRKNSKIQKA